MKKIIILFLVFLPFLLFSQRTITGVVYDQEKQPIPGAIVKVKDMNTSTMTDNNGNYAINVSDEAKFLVFSFTGKETKKIEIKDSLQINVVLKNSDVAISEVDVTALGIKRDEKKVGYGAPNAPISINDGGDRGFNTEEYDNIVDNEFRDALNNPLSTFSIDVDNASYSNVRRFLNNNQKPPQDAIRIEEMINYFDYDYPSPDGKVPFSVITEVSEAPWNKSHKLLHIGIQGEKIDYKDLKNSNLVFLIDVSGSMSAQNKLPLVKESLKLLLNELSKKDKVSIVVYAGSAGVVLEPTPASKKDKIIEALDRLNAGGSTAGGAGIKLAYKIAQENLIQDGNNRVILVTDGDFNVGTSSTGALVDLITEYRKQHDIYLTICGFGMGNYKDGRMEQISNAGNGNYFYIDNKKEAEKVFVKDLRANLFTIAKDVKIQIEFNPHFVKAYRLIGYVNRVLEDEDFEDDKKDAGELGAGHTVTALYEIIPADSDDDVRKIEDLKYQKNELTNAATKSGEFLTLKLRYKPIRSDKSKLIETVLLNEDFIKLKESSDNFRFSAAVAAFGMVLRESEFIDDYDFSDIMDLAKKSYKKDDQYQEEFLELIEKAETVFKTNK